MSAKTALVLRATGVQGKAVAKHLANSSWNVHALVADKSSARALAVNEIGPSVTLYQGTWKSLSTIDAAMNGVDALFLVQMPDLSGDSELSEAKIILGIAKTHGVKHIVHVTNLLLNDPGLKEKASSNIAAPALLGKGEVEALVQGFGIPWTIIRPGFFMTNFMAPLVKFMFPQLGEGKFVSSYLPETVLPHVDPDDIGALAMAAFEAPEEYVGRVISIAGEKLSVEETAKQIGEAMGKELEIVFRSVQETEEASKTNPLIAGQLLTRDMGDWVDLDEVQRLGVQLTSFKEFLAKNKENIL
ncbi:NAD(P)-binding protein [Corynespora cassiicola Philippines]|uniref:NAD(P)-binding protein n=1 Tax=Corynespora cassiicola Philippines TaxID=1448308 RepID=A0A2T2P350_CORCC|nr:NAD(P)-binding protein [Corynespora cassiicola Philippines]